MRFSTAWAKTAAQNVTLKVATVVLAGVSIVQLSVIAGLSIKDPLVIERACFSKKSIIKNSNPTQDEIKSFLTESIPMRFDSIGNSIDGWLAIEESIAREKEIATLKQRQMTQKVLVSEVKFENKDIIVTTDRIMSIGKIKSVLPLNLKVVVQQSTRSESNPYGLILSSISQIEEKEDKK